MIRCCSGGAGDSSALWVGEGGSAAWRDRRSINIPAGWELQLRLIRSMMAAPSTAVLTGGFVAGSVGEKRIAAFVVSTFDVEGTNSIGKHETGAAG